jgi:hypothetical protein
MTCPRDSILDVLAEVAEDGSGADIAATVYAILADHGRPIGADAVAAAVPASTAGGLIEADTCPRCGGDLGCWALSPLREDMADVVGCSGCSMQGIGPDLAHDIGWPSGPMLGDQAVVIAGTALGLDDDSGAEPGLLGVIVGILADGAIMLAEDTHGEGAIRLALGHYAAPCSRADTQDRLVGVVEHVVDDIEHALGAGLVDAIAAEQLDVEVSEARARALARLRDRGVIA